MMMESTVCSQHNTCASAERSEPFECAQCMAVILGLRLLLEAAYEWNCLSVNVFLSPRL